jgi:hypothetical protein
MWVSHVHQILFCLGLPHAQPLVLYEFISVLALRDSAAFMLYACNGGCSFVLPKPRFH